MKLLARLLGDQEAQDAVEYTLMIGLVVMTIWLAVNVFNIPTSLNTIWTNVTETVEAAPGAGS